MIIIMIIIIIVRSIHFVIITIAIVFSLSEFSHKEVFIDSLLLAHHQSRQLCVFK